MRPCLVVSRCRRGKLFLLEAFKLFESHAALLKLIRLLFASLFPGSVSKAAKGLS